MPADWCKSTFCPTSSPVALITVTVVAPFIDAVMGVATVLIVVVPVCTSMGVATTHTLLMHATAAAGHAVPQPPQLASEVVVSVSQPLVRSASQSPRPVLHTPRQTLFWHTTELDWGNESGQRMPHAPQFVALFVVLTSHPFAYMLSQFAKPAVQIGRQVPVVHSPPNEFGTVPHTVPHAPQF